MTYDHKHAESVELQGSEIPFNPQFEFGHGLSYTIFEYGSIMLEKDTMNDREDLNFSFSLISQNIMLHYYYPYFLKTHAVLN